MRVWVRNLTKDFGFGINLPMEELKDVFSPHDEYIITDSEILDVGEYDSIYELNNFLLYCKENDISDETLEILSKAMLYKEVIEAVEKESYIIVNFDSETASWYEGRGGDITNDSHKGMCLFDNNYYNPFGFEMEASIYDWIDWDSVWTQATTENWQEVKVGLRNYLVHR